jgi:hypothetical protein
VVDPPLDLVAAVPRLLGMHDENSTDKENEVPSEISSAIDRRIVVGQAL